MHTRQLQGEQRGVSPVIGVVLMVAITVILAATSATFFFGIQDEAFSDRTPTVAMAPAFGIESGSYELTVRHTGGDTVDPEALRFVVTGASCAGSGDPDGRHTSSDLDNTDADIAAGSRFTLSKTTLCATPSPGDLDLSAAELTVVWMGDEGASSTTLWRWRGPGA